jgi:Fur family peroxide stress response transcriptional regulator
MSVVLKHSKQRDAILNMLRSRYDHPTAEQLYTDLKPSLPKLSLGTVYRNLSLLESIGEVIKISTSGESDRYDGNVGAHYHFACESCGCVDDVPIPFDFEVDKLVSSSIGADIKRHSTIFFGTCKKCLKKS